MRAVLQRVQRAQVTVSGEVVGQIDQGWLVLLGVAPNDTEKDVAWLAEKIVHLRAFSDPDGKMNLSLLDLGFSLLAVSQFTLYGDCQKGRRPSFIGAARPELAEPLYRRFCEQVRSFGVRVAEGRFGADMQVELVNDGPVTLILENRGTS